VTDRDPNAASFTRTLRLKVKRECYGWLNAAAVEVNQVWNWANATSIDAADRNRRAHARFLSGFDLCSLAAGATEYFERIGSDTIQRICTEYALKRKAAKRARLRFRVSRGARRSLGWVPFKAASLKRKGVCLRFCGKHFRVFERATLDAVKWRDGCFAQDAVGDWWLCLPVLVPGVSSLAPRAAVGIDLGLKEIAVTSDGERLEAGRWTGRFAAQLASAQRRGHKHHSKRIHRKAARCRADALHKFSRKVVDTYQNIVVGDVSTSALVRTRMAKSVLDAGWGMLRAQLLYKGEHAGRSVMVASERNTSRTCSSCGALSGPQGVNGLRVRSWICCECGDSHDRDVNAARLILLRAEVSASVRGNESSPPSARRAGHSRPREARISTKAVAA
jgi:IS605 OrfB family transposase